jgi:hypothetical protein
MVFHCFLKQTAPEQKREQLFSTAPFAGGNGPPQRIPMLVSSKRAVYLCMKGTRLKKAGTLKRWKNETLRPAIKTQRPELFVTLVQHKCKYAIT